MIPETLSHEGPKCPHCGRQYTADESHYYDEMNYTEETCDKCNKTFSVSVHSSVSWVCAEIEEAENCTPTSTVETKP